MVLGVLYLVQLSVALMKTIKGFFTALQAGALEPGAELEPTITAEDQDQRAEPPGAEAPHGEAAEETEQIQSCISPTVACDEEV